MTLSKTLPRVDPHVLDDLLTQGSVEVEAVSDPSALVVISYARQVLILPGVQGDSDVRLEPGCRVFVQSPFFWNS